MKTKAARGLRVPRKIDVFPKMGTSDRWLENRFKAPSRSKLTSQGLVLLG